MSVSEKFASLEHATEAAAEYAADEILKIIRGRINRNAMICIRKLAECVEAEAKFPIETPWGIATNLTDLMLILVHRQAEIVCDICTDVADLETAIGQIGRELYAQIERGAEPSLAVLEEVHNGVRIKVGVIAVPPKDGSPTKNKN